MDASQSTSRNLPICAGLGGFVINSRDLGELVPEAAALCRAFVAKCKAAGIDVLIISTFRDAASQAALFAQGRTEPGAVVTKAEPGFSFHQFRVAFDFVPIVNGKAQWNDLRSFKLCGEIAKEIGLTWAGDWTTFKEYGHCQLPGLTIAGLRCEFGVERAHV